MRSPQRKNIIKVKYLEFRSLMAISNFIEFIIQPLQSKIIESTLIALQEILKKRIYTPTQKLLAMKFCQDSIELFNDYYISLFQLFVLPTIEFIALFKKQSKEEDRGKWYFDGNSKVKAILFISDQELQQIGNSFLQLTLENIWVWSKWFPVDPDSLKISAYKFTLERLIIKGVNLQCLNYPQVQHSHNQNIMIHIMFCKKCQLSQRLQSYLAKFRTVLTLIKNFFLKQSTGEQGSEYEQLAEELTKLDRIQEKFDIGDKFVHLLMVQAKKNGVGPQFQLKQMNPLCQQQQSVPLPALTSRSTSKQRLKIKIYIIRCFDQRQYTQLEIGQFNDEKGESSQLKQERSSSPIMSESAIPSILISSLEIKNLMLKK